MQKPTLPIKLTTTDRVIEGVSVILLLVGVVYGSLSYSSLPQTIPTHFGISGQPDGFGNKYNLLVVMGANVLVFGLMSLVHKYPALINYPFHLTPENEERHFKNAFRMISVLKLFLPILFGEIIYSTVQTAQGNQTGLGIGMLVAVIGLTFSLGYFMYKGYLISKSHAL
jgi:uncharacterized membrane protein